MPRTIYIVLITFLFIYGCQQIKDEEDILLDRLETCTLKQEEWINKIEELNNNREQIKNLNEDEKSKIKEQIMNQFSKDKEEFDNILQKLEGYDVYKFSPQQLKRFDTLTDKAHLATQRMIEVFKKIKENSNQSKEISNNKIEKNNKYSSIELYDLVIMFAPEEENTINDWFTGAESATPILWETEGIEFVDENDFNYILGAFERKGTVIITVENEPLYVLSKKKEVVQWEIKLYGPRIGIYSLYTNNYLLSHNNCFNDDCVKSYFTKRNAIVKTILSDDENMFSYGKRFYEISIKNKPKIYLTLDFSSGSAGYMGEYIFHFVKPTEDYFSKQGLTKSIQADSVL